jgi:hypothetical protein
MKPHLIIHTFNEKSSGTFFRPGEHPNPKSSGTCLINPLLVVLTACKHHKAGSISLALANLPGSGVMPRRLDARGCDHCLASSVPARPTTMKYS